MNINIEGAGEAQSQQAVQQLRPGLKLVHWSNSFPLVSQFTRVKFLANNFLFRDNTGNQYIVIYCRH